MKKRFVKRIALIAAVGIMLVGVNASTYAAAKGNKGYFDNFTVTAKSKEICHGTVGSKVHHATVTVSARQLQDYDLSVYCHVFFTQKNKKNKYVTVGAWLTNVFGSVNTKYIEDRNGKFCVNSGDTLTTMSQTLKNQKSGLSTTCITGNVKY